MPTRTKGTDLLITMEGPDQVPAPMEMTEKMTATDLKKKFGRDASVYQWNKDLQNLPR